MKGLMLFVAGLLCGGALVAWLFLGDEPVVPMAPPSSLPMPVATADGAGLRPASDVAMAEPDAAAWPTPDLAVAPLEDVAVPAPEVPRLEPSPPEAATLEPSDTKSTDATAADTPAVPPATEAPEAATTAPPAPAASPQALTPPDPAVLAKLRATTLLLPVQGVEPAQLSDTYSDARGEGRSHDAIDIMAPTGRPVRAVADGRVAKLFTSVPGGLTIYQFDTDAQVAFYYAHLDRYAEGIGEGQDVKRGDVIGYVGSTGNANPAGPHLHFAIFVLGPEKKWWQGTAVNPYPILRRATTEPAGAP